jgi:hypothetical protein
MLAKDAKYAQYDQNLMDGLDQIHTSLLYRALSTGGLVIGSTSKKEVKIASTINYLHNGVFKAKTTAEVAFTATTMDIAPNASSVQEAVYLLSLIADGTPTVTMGTVATGSGAALLPEVPTGKTPVGYVRVAVAAGATKFDATTDDLDAGHLTVTYVNLGYVAPKFSAVQ